MNDKILIIYGLGNFDTSPSGVLEVKDGKVVLNKVKAFNRARIMMNCGCNMFRILVGVYGQRFNLSTGKMKGIGLY